MHKSISLLRDLAPSENVIDSQAQLYPLHRLRPAQTKQHLIICFLEIQILTSPRSKWQGCDRPAGSTRSPWPHFSELTMQQTARTSGEQELRGLPKPTWKQLLVCWAHSTAAVPEGCNETEGSALSPVTSMCCRAMEKTDKPWKARLVLIEDMFDTYIWFINQLQIIQFPCSFLPSKWLNMITPTFKWRSYYFQEGIFEFYLWKGHNHCKSWFSLERQLWALPPHFCFPA